jgi:hypothetical protein
MERCNLTSEPLNLSGADTSGYQPAPAGRYLVHVDEVDWREASGDGKLPMGTPMLSVRFVIDSDLNGNTDNEGKTIYSNYILPPDEYASASEENAKNSARMKGIFVRFICAATGEDEAKVTSGKYKLDEADLVGRQVVASVGVRPETDQYDAQNTIKGVRSLSDAQVEAGGLL